MTPFPWEWIERIIRINSVSHRSNLPLIRFLLPLAKSLGLKTRIQEVNYQGVRQGNLLVYRNEFVRRPLLLMNTHLDTVSPGEKDLWKTDPYRATRRGDAVFGLGTADVKIDFLCKLWAFGNSQSNDLSAVLVGTFGEEVGLVGARRLLESQLVRPRYAVIGEPSDLELIYSHKGHVIGTVALPAPAKRRGSRTVTWRGRAAHTSTPQLGRNALRLGLREIEKRKWGILQATAGTDLNKVPELFTAELQDENNPQTENLLEFIRRLEAIEKRIQHVRNPDFRPAQSTLSLNMLRTSKTQWELTFDIRTVPGVEVEQVRKAVERAAGPKSRWIRLTADAPLRGRKSGVLMNMAALALRKTGASVRRKTKASSTEAAIYNQHGTEAIIFGPGVSVGNVHRPNERNSIRQIRIATQFYGELLRAPWERRAR